MERTSAAQWVQNIFTRASHYCIAIPAIILNTSCQSLRITARAEVFNFCFQQLYLICSNFTLFAATLPYLQQLLFVWNNNIFLFAAVFINFP